ncbi:MAG TPA: transcription-repair coupling factor [bacterium]|jgi:transcription-repair coupling factor (superfamily II helicase)|nr:transcription-repair coupling factor [bacterium]
MFFQAWFKRLYDKSFDETARRALEAGKLPVFTGSWGAARAFLAAALLSQWRRPALLLAADEASALALTEELRFFLQGFPSLADPLRTEALQVKYPTVLDPGLDPLVYFPAWETGTVDSVNREHGRTLERLLILRRLARGEPLIVVTTLEALVQAAPDPGALLGAELYLRVGQDYRLEELAAALVRLGYRREAAVEEAGQFSIRGGLLDLAAPDRDYPVRCEFFGDTLEKMRPFDPLTQRSLGPESGEIGSLDVMPFQEVLVDEAIKAAGLKRVLAQSGLKAEARQRWHEQLRDQSHYVGLDWLLGFFFPGLSLFDYLDCWKTKPLIFVDQPQALPDRLKELADAHEETAARRHSGGLLYPGASAALLPVDEVLKRLRRLDTVAFSLLPHGLPGWRETLNLPLAFKNLDLTAGDLGSLEREMTVWLGRDWRSLVACHSHGELTRLKLALSERGLDGPELGAPGSGLPGLEELQDRPGYTLGHLDKGFSAPELGLVLVSDQDALRREVVRTTVYRHRFQGLKNARKIESFAELKVGQHAVHVDHGIGLFQGVVRLNVDGFEKDFVSLEYADREKLYVPVEQVDKVQKYLGGDDMPRLHKLGTATWESQRERVKKAVAEMAEELLKLYAKRQVVESPGTGPDTAWQKAFEESFPYQETDDQKRAIEEIKRDMESRKPLDRLLCGDVGFGKTEVALRAAFKAAASGQQAALLAPTTILASQHFNTFGERLQGFPLRLGLLSRFRSPKEQKKTLEGLREGTIDIVIGTHRLLSRDVAFKRLGLLIIDEEQRFGVAQKERLKTLRTQVGVLAMSATPVPRTLHFSLSGMRDMSLIESPPLNRLPVRTYVIEEDPAVLREALLAELKRGGQVFYVHHRVKDIEKVAGRLRALVPEAHIAVAHGQMPKEELERVMLEFLGRAHDVLVATTIIESGLDIPNVNTIIVDHAEDFGLSQLYQLRGRVGRSQRQAYCYLFYPKNRALPEVAEKRLAAIEEFTELGAGFKVAMRDLEIRGVGNILGPQQHGNVSAVGFDLYCHLLNEAVARLKGEDVEQDRSPTLNLDRDAYIPQTYIEDERQKLDWYKRLAAVESHESLAAHEEEMTDRYGEIPGPVRSLLEVVAVRVWARDLGLSEVTQKGSQIVLRFFEDRQPGPEFASAMMRAWGEKVRFLQGPPPGLSFTVAPGQGPTALRSLLPSLGPYAILSSRELTRPG